MLFRHRGLALLLLAAGGALLALSCRSSRTEPVPTPTASSTAALAGGFPAQSLRDVDWRSAPVMDEIRKHFGDGLIEPRRVAYIDFTGDGREEALVIVESGGTAGDLGAAVYRLEAGRAGILAWIDRTGSFELRLPNAGPGAALIIVKQGIFGPGDANCCPSRIRETALRWDGSTFAVFGEQTLPANP